MTQFIALDSLSYGTPLGDDPATYGIWLHAVAIRPNSSKV